MKSLKNKTLVVFKTCDFCNKKSIKTVKGWALYIKNNEKQNYYSVCEDHILDAIFNKKVKK